MHIPICIRFIQFCHSNWLHVHTSSIFHSQMYRISIHSVVLQMIDTPPFFLKKEQYNKASFNLKMKLQLNFQESILIGCKPHSSQFNLITFSMLPLYVVENNKQVAFVHFMHGKGEKTFTWIYIVVFKVLYAQGRNQGGGGAPQVHVHPPFKKKTKPKNHKKNPNYFLCRIIRFYTNNPKCQYVYLSFYLNDYQIIDKVNTI